MKVKHSTYGGARIGSGRRNLGRSERMCLTKPEKALIESLRATGADPVKLMEWVKGEKR